ncbi:fumarylacetoacetate hydrolase family protein [Gordonia shandongensis]|uniref:fumarylacetoacetate hydrolase family protein n=1 Tax=Gordonia shandongensis TaxID=376351 RepID=UPI000418A43D|nr:fumarylacetoacetate hydrolase family protein [Gordonia shandongensis]
MRLATLRLDHTTVAARVDDDAAVTIDGFTDLSALLADPDWSTIAADADGTRIALADADYAPVVPHPGKIVCVGLNYATHITEMGRDLPTHPTLFAKFADALTGAYDDVIVPAYAAEQLDWEAELAVIIGRDGYQVPQADAARHIAGYSVINDYTMRDYQYRTLQWDQGKTFEKSSGFGPVLDTDYVLGTPIQTVLDGEVMQSSNTGDLVFGPEFLVEYISHIVTLRAGDVIITGTTGGVGHARTPARYIQDGETVEVSIGDLGTVRNTTRIR